MAKQISIIFPNQLFADSALLNDKHPVYLIEEYLFFKQYAFHKQKLAFHRATMKAYQQYLEEKNIAVQYIESNHKLADIRHFTSELKAQKVSDIHLIEPTDEWLEQRIRKLANHCKLHFYEDPQFLNSKQTLHSFFKPKKKSFFQTSFYKQERKNRNILMEGDAPAGGKWSFDSENRKKYPKGKTPPPIHYPDRSETWDEAVNYVEKHFGDNPGELSKDPFYPITHTEANDWFDQFLNYRFYDFGAYEDAIVKGQSILHHSVLTPMLNNGLLVPQQVVDRALAFAREEDIPLNSTEGFIRQIIGWREFIRGMYLCKGNFSRTQNALGFTRKIPKSFYNGTTGIAPVDDTIKAVLKTGYCHHIERLMVLGNFMLLCEFDPDEVYRWFMELFIDAYDWVMVPNVYGMSQFADGGTFATKPYIGGSNYIRKMSNYSNGDWADTWDGLFWNFVHNHQKLFTANPRTGMLVHTLDRMSKEKRKGHFEKAESFLSGL